MNHLESGQGKITISVCVATYRRESLLENLLKSLEAQQLPLNISLEIVVVDNDKDGSAEKVLNNFTSVEKIEFKYFIQPIKNISLTRNLSVKNASGDYICFIDDDETASVNWIKNFFNALNNYNADGAFGYVEPIFDNNIPVHFKKREYYFTPVGKTGTLAHFYFTTNAIVKSELIKSEIIPFDSDYGLTGGEDVHLFERLERKGAKFINCMDAVSYEFIPNERATKRYLFNRALRGGQSFLRRKLENKNSLSFKFITIFKIVLRFLFGIFLLFLYPISKNKSILGVLSIGDAIGKFRAFLLKFKNIY